MPFSHHFDKIGGGSEDGVSHHTPDLETGSTFACVLVLGSIGLAPFSMPLQPSSPFEGGNGKVLNKRGNGSEGRTRCNTRLSCPIRPSSHLIASI
jgi:hypothetical protein